MDKIDEIFENYKKGIEQIDEKYKKIDENYRKNIKSMNITFISVFLIIFILSFRVLFIGITNTTFERYAQRYSFSIDSKIRTPYDADIVYEKIKCDKVFSTAINPLKWTKYQITKNKELYLKCKEAYIEYEKQEKIKYNEAEKSFDERLKNEE